MKWLSQLHTNEDISLGSPFIDSKDQEVILAHIQMPEWAAESSLTIARNFFTRNSPWILNLLGLLSLPYCYAASDGARVLCFTERLTKEPEIRLRETAEFVWDIMNPLAFLPENKGLVSILKVRLIHSSIRYYIRNDPNWEAAWGLPINQEDMAGTNLSFSLLILRGLRKMGIESSLQEKEAYLHLWNVVGFLLGLDESLLANNLPDTIHLEKMIRERQFKASLHGKNLTKKLLDYLTAIPKDPSKPKIYIQNWMVDLIGEPVAEILDVKRAKEKGFSIKWISLLNQFGLLDAQNKKSTFQSRYKTFTVQNSKPAHLKGKWTDFSAYPIPEYQKY
jgi:ER-bound oxygenase mpaB/B'/Rubber oxygenase, catalytic domain